MIVAGLLSVMMGVVLGLLGGGGSILTVPILLYAVGIDAKAAIATSLFVVGVTSLVGAIRHARLGNVAWRTGLVFGGAGMVGAYGGGLLAGYIDGAVLLLLFAGLMAVSAIAMLRPRRATPELEGGRPFKPVQVIIEGLVVGAVTGLVGAGGGFLVVPALVLFGGMSMRGAIGTSLLVIALKSFAGLAGHLAHASIDLELAGLVTGAAVLGAFAGTALSTRVRPEQLRRVFALLVLGMAVFMVRKEAPPEVIDALFVDRWPLWAALLAAAGIVAGTLLYRRYGAPRRPASQRATPRTSA